VRKQARRMTNPEDDKRIDFGARAFEHKGRAEARRLQAETTADPAMKAIHTDAAGTYEDMALELDKTAKRITEIDRATARVRARISANRKPPLPTDSTPEPVGGGTRTIPSNQ
jgi:hypothetical protein